MATEHIQQIPKVVPAGSVPDVEGHTPYVPDLAVMPEFTLSAVLVGAVLGIIFGASSLYLVLKVGMTVSASIPVAVLSITLFRWAAGAFGIRKATLLENNIVQTTGSAGESIAFGVGVTMPALMLIGFEMEWSRVLVVSVLGGLLGILMMIPLRRAFIVKLHGKPGEPGKLLYPEGTACAQVLITGEKGGTSGRTVFIGFGLAFAHKFLTEGVNLFATTVKVPLDFFSRAARLTSDMASELLGVGYIIGVRTSCIMMAGAVLGGLVITPTIAMSSDAAAMDTKQIYGTYLRIIGAGCVAAAGIISMTRTLPLIVRSFMSGVAGMRGGGARFAAPKRTENDLSPSVVLGGSLVLLVLLAVFLLTSDDKVTPATAMLGALLVLVFGFLFVTVSSRLTGEIGSSSNPISGMTVATLLMTCLIFLALGLTRPTDAVLALSIGGVVCIAASNGGTTSQDLKTGYLIGATPRWQQWAILIGALTSAVVIGGTLLLFNNVGTVYSQRNLPPVRLDADELRSIPEKETHAGEEFFVWRPSDEVALPSRLDGKPVSVKPGKYLVDAAGLVCFHVDPTITGNLDQRDEFLLPGEANLTKEELATVESTVLTKEELSRLETTVGMRPKADPKSSPTMVYYRLWNNDKKAHDKAVAAKKEDKNKPEAEPYRPEVKEGMYLVDAAGKITHVVKGTKVSMKFEAPKTQVMGTIINGLLREKLNWSLVLIGACIAIALELCGVSSLAFAVGLYIPMQYSTPIFIGGLVRWAVDAVAARHNRQDIAAAAELGEAAKAEAEVRAIAKSETSPGMLLASGLIAGGSLAGVTLAFFEFVPDIKQGMDLEKPVAKLYESATTWPVFAQDTVALVLFAGLAAVLLLAGMGKIFQSSPDEEAKANAIDADR